MKATRTLSSRKLLCHTPARSVVHTTQSLGTRCKEAVRGGAAVVLSFRVQVQPQTHTHTQVCTHNSN